MNPLSLAWWKRAVRRLLRCLRLRPSAPSFPTRAIEAGSVKAEEIATPHHDYGHWQGARRAIDEYFHEQRACYLMQRLDYTGRMLIKK